MNKFRIPKALFSCHFDCCREEVSYPADMLYWCEFEKGWICDNCFDNVTGEYKKGISLANYIQNQKLLAVEIL